MTFIDNTDRCAVVSPAVAAGSSAVVSSTLAIGNFIDASFLVSAAPIGAVASLEISDNGTAWRAVTAPTLTATVDGDPLLIGVQLPQQPYVRLRLTRSAGAVGPIFGILHRSRSGSVSSPMLTATFVSPTA